jgi:hypothetical protein
MANNKPKIPETAPRPPVLEGSKQLLEEAKALHETGV